MPTVPARTPEETRAAAVDRACSAAPPVWEAYRTSTSRSSSASSSASGAVTGAAATETRRNATAQTLNSGCRLSGSTASCVTALTATSSPKVSFQWNGAKQQPGRTRSVTTAGSTTRPRRDRTSTPSPSAMPSRSAS